MKEINEEIKLTLDSTQKTDIDEGSQRSWFEQDVSTLVEALELIIKAAPGRGVHYGTGRSRLPKHA